MNKVWILQNLYIGDDEPTFSADAIAVFASEESALKKKKELETREYIREVYIQCHTVAD